MRIIRDIEEQRIRLFHEKGAENNRRILKYIALNGAMLKYDIAKKAGAVGYSTVSRRINDLIARGYLAEAGRRPTLRGRQKEESMYGLTWKGFIASATFGEVRSNIPKVLRMNPLLTLPEKELVLELLDELVTRQEIQVIMNSLVEKLLETIPDLELMENQQLPMIMLSALTRVTPPADFKLSKIPENVLELLDRPAILQIVKEYVVPYLREYATQIRIMYQFASALSGFGTLLCSLEPEDQPSKKIKEFLENRSHRLSRIKALSNSRGEKNHGSF
jgi:hypothetical protein